MSPRHTGLVGADRSRPKVLREVNDEDSSRMPQSLIDESAEHETIRVLNMVEL